MAPSARMQRPRNPYSSAEIDRSSHERENEERMIELASSGAARFVPIDSERNLVNKGSGNPEPVFLQGMMARAVVGAAGASRSCRGHRRGSSPRARTRVPLPGAGRRTRRARPAVSPGR